MSNVATIPRSTALTTADHEAAVWSALKSSIYPGASDQSIIAQATESHEQLEPAIITDAQLAGYVQQVGDRIVASAREMVNEGFERDRIYNEFFARVGEVVVGEVKRFEKSAIVLVEWPTESYEGWAKLVGAYNVVTGEVMASGLSEAGMQALTSPRSVDEAKRQLQAAGYRGERVVFMAPTDFAAINAMSLVTGDLLRGRAQAG